MSHFNLSESDIILNNFLSFLSQDMDNNPQRIQPIDSSLLDRIRCLIADVEFDIDTMLSDDDRELES